MELNMNKKLQVFVSSTYTDLIEERQAAVQAILDSGHIPAGMELFKAGNKSQLKTIYKWIDESDVYMLILGGRYGSIEYNSGKSYIQLEYEYALSKNIPVFSLILSENYLTNKLNSIGLSKITEQKEPNKYIEFKSFVMSKIIREVDDCKDIKIQVFATLNEFIQEYDLAGWVRNSSEKNTLQLLQENKDLFRENNSLKSQIQKLQEQLKANTNEQFGRFSFDNLIEIFKNKHFTIPAKVINKDKDLKLDALDFYISYFDILVTGVSNEYLESDLNAYIFYYITPFYVSYDFLERVKLSGTTAQRIHTTKLGSSFYAMLASKGMIKEK